MVKRWQKMMIWFFGISLLDLLVDIIKVLKWGWTILNITNPQSWMGLILIIIVPMMFMKDDKDTFSKLKPTKSRSHN